MGIETCRNVDFWYLSHVCTVGLYQVGCSLDCIFVTKMGSVPEHVYFWTWHQVHQHVLHTHGKHEVALHYDLRNSATQIIYFTVQCFYSSLLSPAVLLWHKSIYWFQVNKNSSRPKRPWVARCSSRIDILKPYSLKDSLWLRESREKY